MRAKMHLSVELLKYGGYQLREPYSKSQSLAENLTASCRRDGHDLEAGICSCRINIKHKVQTVILRLFQYAFGNKNTAISRKYPASRNHRGCYVYPVKDDRDIKQQPQTSVYMGLAAFSRYWSRYTNLCSRPFLKRTDIILPSLITIFWMMLTTKFFTALVSIVFIISSKSMYRLPCRAFVIMKVEAFSMNSSWKKTVWNIGYEAQSFFCAFFNNISIILIDF